MMEGASKKIQHKAEKVRVGFICEGKVRDKNASITLHYIIVQTVKHNL
jgi:hypothetical protein